MLDTIYVFDSKKYGTIFLNGPYRVNPARILKLYIDWYHSDYAYDEEVSDDRSCDDFVFKDSRCAMDFYDDYKDLYIK